jgi:hypothetical protein
MELDLKKIRIGMVGLVPLTLCYRRIRRLEEDAG